MEQQQEIPHLLTSCKTVIWMQKYIYLVDVQGHYIKSNSGPSS